jgi:hypothetical protein
VAELLADDFSTRIEAVARSFVRLSTHPRSTRPVDISGSPPGNRPRTGAASAVDGTPLRIGRIAADRPCYSGKHKRHGVNARIRTAAVDDRLDPPYRRLFRRLLRRLALGNSAEGLGTRASGVLPRVRVVAVLRLVSVSSIRSP